jgi:Putative adhesin
MKTTRNLALLALTLALGVLPLSAASTGHFERSLQVTGAVDLEVSSGSGNITIHTGGSNTVSVSAKMRASGSSWLFGGGDVEERIRRIEQHPPIEQQGNVIRIGKFEDRELSRNISIDYDVTVPAQTKLNTHTGSGDQQISGVQLSVTAKTGSGNITAENLGADAHLGSGSGDVKVNSIKGGLHAETGSGNIRAQGVSGEIVANTGSGDIEMHQAAPGDVRVETGSGNVRLYNVKGGLRADTGSGDIHAEGEATHDWRLGAGSGNITLRLPSSASFNLDARTSSGTLKVNHPVTMQGAMSRNHIQGKVGNGGVLLDMHTGSGDINID